jgi:hypothetical protein
MPCYLDFDASHSRDDISYEALTGLSLTWRVGYAIDRGMTGHRHRHLAPICHFNESYESRRPMSRRDHQQLTSGGQEEEAHQASTTPHSIIDTLTTPPEAHRRRLMPAVRAHGDNYYHFAFTAAATTSLLRGAASTSMPLCRRSWAARISTPPLSHRRHAALMRSLIAQPQARSHLAHT